MHTVGKLEYSRSEIGNIPRRKSFVGYAKTEVGERLRQGAQFGVSISRVKSFAQESLADCSWTSEIKLRQAINNYIQSAAAMNECYTLPVDNQLMGNMMQAVLACHHCKDVLTKIKQLQCFHPMCQKCINLLKTKHMDSGKFLFFW